MQAFLHWHAVCQDVYRHSAVAFLQVHVKVEIPNKLSNDERKIVEELREIQSSKPAKKKGFSLF